MNKILSSLLIGLMLLPNAWAVKINGQLEGAVLEKLGSDPSAKEGRIYYNTATKKAKIHNGTSYGELGGGGSGGGAVRDYLTDDFEAGMSGWSTYQDSGSVPTDCTGGSPNLGSGSTSEALSGTTSGLLVKDAANRIGEGWAKSFTVDSAISGNPQSLTITGDLAVNSGTFTFGADSIESDAQIYVYDVTGSKLLVPTTSKILGQHFSMSVMPTSGSTSYRLCVHQATTSASAYQLKIDNIKISTQSQINAAPITSDEVYPTGRLSAGFGTVTLEKIWYSRFADKLRVRGSFKCGTVTGNQPYILLPAGLLIDTAKAGSGADLVGQWWTASDGATANHSLDGSTANLHGPIAFDGTNADAVFFTKGAGSNVFTKVGTSTILTDSDSVGFDFTVPISGWSSNQQASSDVVWVDDIGEVFSVAAASCPANTIPAANKTVCKSGCDYSGSQYFALYEKVWGMSGATDAAGPFKFSSAKGASAIADWDAAKTLTVDMRGYFVRQSGGSSGTVGAAQAQATAKNGLSNAASSVTGSVGGADGTHNHTDSGHSHEQRYSSVDKYSGGGGTGIPYNNSVINSGVNTATSYANITATNSGHGHGFSLTAGAQTITGDTETRPTNVALNFCVRYAKTPAPVVVQDDTTPAGTVINFAGSTCPTGYLEADGTSKSRASYSKLFAAVGTSWGTADANSFNLPDLRGRMLRGVDGGAARDPDRASRTACNSGGNTGDMVGSCQADTFKGHNHSSASFASPSHTHDQGNLYARIGIETGGYLYYQETSTPTWTVNARIAGTTSGVSTQASVGTNVVGNTGASANTSLNSDGGSETRPINAYVKYCIKH